MDSEFDLDALLAEDDDVADIGAAVATAAIAAPPAPAPAPAAAAPAAPPEPEAAAVTGFDETEARIGTQFAIHAIFLWTIVAPMMFPNRDFSSGHRRTTETI